MQVVLSKEVSSPIQPKEAARRRLPPCARPSSPARTPTPAVWASQAVKGGGEIEASFKQRHPCMNVNLFVFIYISLSLCLFVSLYMHRSLTRASIALELVELLSLSRHAHASDLSE